MLNIENQILLKQKTFNFILVKELIFLSIDHNDSIVLERTYSMWIPGFGTEDPKQYKKFLTNDTLKAVSRYQMKVNDLCLFIFLVTKNTIYVFDNEYQSINFKTITVLIELNYGNAFFLSLSNVYIVKSEIKSCIYSR